MSTGPIRAVPAPREPGRPYRVSFVCTGNICRSPMAEVVFRELAAAELPGSSRSVEASSAGTGPWHAGEPMDPRARDALVAAGWPDHGHVAQQVAVERFAHLDLVVALARRHSETLRSLDTKGALTDRLVLLRNFDPAAGGALDVPDPYYGDAADFAACLDQVEAACRGLVAALAVALGDPAASP